VFFIKRELFLIPFGTTFAELSFNTGFINKNLIYWIYQNKGGVIMAQRWSFEEEYIICDFAYGHMLRTISKQELLHLSLRLKENSDYVRNESVLRRKIRIYQYAFSGNMPPYATKQMRGISDAYIKRLINPEYYEKLASRINQLDSISESDELYVGDNIQFLTSSLHHLRPLVARKPSFKEVLIDFNLRSPANEVFLYAFASLMSDTAL